VFYNGCIEPCTLEKGPVRIPGIFLL